MDYLAGRSSYCHCRCLLLRCLGRGVSLNGFRCYSCQPSVIIFASEKCDDLLRLFLCTNCFNLWKTEKNRKKSLVVKWPLYLSAFCEPVIEKIDINLVLKVPALALIIIYFISVALDITFSDILSKTNCSVLKRPFFFD